MPIHPFWLANTCLIFRRRESEKKEVVVYDKDCVIRGTGFFVSYQQKNLLVTAKHVVQSIQGNELNRLGYGFNYKKTDGSIVNIVHDIDDVHKKYNIEWYYHPNPEIDLAVSIVDLPKDFTPLFNEQTMIPYSELNIGSRVYYLGYPLGLISKDDLSPTIKDGIIARKIDKSTHLPNVDFHDKTVLINSYFDAGNSGSPIIQSSGILTPGYPNFPEIKIREGLVGIVTKQFSPLLFRNDIFEQRFTYGLGVSLPVDYLFEIFNSEKMKKEYLK